MLINAESTPKMRERSERAKILELFDFVCHFDENWNVL